MTVLCPIFSVKGRALSRKVSWRRGGLDASEVLAKHDERYMPKEVVDALKKSGRWQENADMGASQ